jgi:DNA repair exonuclease SbcCD nuclease subunit
MTNLNNLNIIHLSDLHLGHPRLDSSLLLKNIQDYLFPYIEKADLLLFTGDMFHSLMSMNSPDIETILSLFIQLYELLEKHNVVARFLKGTDIHDRNQLSIWYNLYKENNYKNDVKYFDKVTIEYIDKLDVRCLYIPEVVPFNTTEQLVLHVEELFCQAGWDKCDLICGHGFLDYTLPPMKHKPKILFTKDMFRRLLKPGGRVCMGHVHTSSTNEFVEYAGSFSRCTQNEEEKKGFFFIEKNNPIFVENKGAVLQKTINLGRYADIEDCIKLYKEFMIQFPKDKVSYVRVIHTDVNIRHILNKITIDEYPYIRYSHISKEGTNSLSNTQVKLNKIEIEEITDSNIGSVTYKYLQENNRLSLTENEVCDLLQQLEG